MLPSNQSKPKNNTETAVEKLRALIFSGELPAGSDHLETELAFRLGMSRTPVREAALMLEAQGLLEVRARKGVRILPVSVQDMEEIYDVLTALESMAAGQAAHAGLDSDAIGGLERAIADMEMALRQENREAWAEADDRFHTELVRLGGNSRMVAIVALMADQVRRARAMTLYLRPLPVKSNEDHRQVLEAISAGDAETASRIHKAHRDAAKSTLVALLRQNRLHML